jgi:hypothetical protein
MAKNRPSHLVLALSIGLLFAGCRDSGVRKLDPPPPLLPLMAALTSPSALRPLLKQDLSEKPSQTEVDEFAWRSFVALNWPANELKPGEPDMARQIGEAATSVVWETWKSPEQVFLEGGKRPPGWDEPAGELPSKCRINPEATGDTKNTGTKLLRRLAKAGEELLPRDKQAVGGTLTDQHRNLVRYEIRFNKPEFDYIVDNGLFQQEQQVKRIQLPVGSIEVKAAWREMTSADSAAVRQRFYRKRAWLYTPGAPEDCRLVEMGLVGLHITQKTPHQPQWIWATFEHVDNAPPFNQSGSPDRRFPYSFHNPTCSTKDCPPNQSTDEGRPIHVPTQVVRRVAIRPEVEALNRHWQERLAKATKDSPWQYYELVGTQWPKAPSHRYGSPTPTTVSNTTMETYVENSSCMDCHSKAKTITHKYSADYSFMLLEAKPSTSRGAR